MPFALIIIGLVLVICAARGTLGQLGTLLKGDFTGQGNFVYWLAAMGIVGSIGYIRQMQPFSRAFLALVLVAMLLSNREFFAQLKTVIEQLSAAGSSGSGPAGNTLDNSQPAPQNPGSGTGQNPVANAINGVIGGMGQTGSSVISGAINNGIGGAVTGLLGF